ncbi:MAG: hypothetical protein ACLR1T_12995 [Evtepia gabavorous]
MELERVKGNTWVLKSWGLIPSTRWTTPGASCWTRAPWTSGRNWRPPWTRRG